jgi:hypothetical protein
LYTQFNGRPLENYNIFTTWTSPEIPHGKFQRAFPTSSIVNRFMVNFAL